MSNKITEADPIELLQNTDHILSVVNGQLKRVPTIFFRKDGYKGLVLKDDNPDSPPAIGDFYICNDIKDATYVNFGNTKANPRDRFYWNGQGWDHIQFENFLQEGYQGVKEPNAAAIANPENGWWIRCKEDGNYVNYSNITAVGQDILIYNESAGAWERSLAGPQNAILLNDHMDANNNQINNLESVISSSSNAASNESVHQIVNSWLNSINPAANEQSRILIDSIIDIWFDLVPAGAESHDWGIRRVWKNYERD